MSSEYSKMHASIPHHRATGATGQLGALLVLTVMQSALLGACSGGGGGRGGGPTSFGNTLPPTTGPGDAETLFPNTIGNVWYYDATSTPSSGAAVTSFDMVTVTGQQTVNGQSATVFLETSSASPGTSVENYYYKNAGGVAYLGDSPSDALSLALAPYVEALFPVATGTVANFGKSAVNLGVDLDGDKINETADLNLNVSVAGFEALATALGSFTRTEHGTESVTGTITLSSNHTTVPFASTQNIWSAPGVGVVKRTLSVMVQNATQQTVFEARGYIVDGVGRGLGLPFTVLTNLGTANTDIYTPGRPSLACDGSNCLVVSSSPTGVVGALFDARGRSVASVNLGTAGSTATVFDGTNYLVIVSSPGAPLRAHRVTTAGVSLDGMTGIASGSGMATPSGLGPAAALGSANTLVVYSTYDTVLNQHLLYGVLLDRNGMATTA